MPNTVRCLGPCWLAVALAGFGSQGEAGGPSVPAKLTPETFEAIKAASLAPEDLAWQQVRWRDGFFEGLREAQAADKPIFFWFYGGGLAGNCWQNGVKSRQLVCNDARVLDLLKEFIPTADGCDRYSHVALQNAPGKQSLEYHLLQDAMMQTSWRDSLRARPDGWHVQGIYIITPSGKVIAGTNHPMNVESNLSEMRKGLEAYARMPREQRLLSRAPDPKQDRLRPENERPRPPVDGLILRVVGRGLDDNLNEVCHLRPKFHILDRLWYTRDEALQFLPDNLRPGQRKDVTGPVLNGLAQLYLNARGSQFYDNEVKELRLTSEVLEAVGPAVKLSLTGRAVLEATHMFNPSTYRSDLLGYLTYDTEKKSFTQFELLAYGLHNLGPADMKEGGPKHVPVAFRFTLNDGSSVSDSQVPTKLGLYRFVKLQAAGQASPR